MDLKQKQAIHLQQTKQVIGMCKAIYGELKKADCIKQRELHDYLYGRYVRANKLYHHKLNTIPFD